MENKWDGYSYVLVEYRVAHDDDELYYILNADWLKHSSLHRRRGCLIQQS